MRHRRRHCGQARPAQAQGQLGRAPPTSQPQQQHQQQTVPRPPPTPPPHLQVSAGVEKLSQLVVPHTDALLDKVGLVHTQLCRQYRPAAPSSQRAMHVSTAQAVHASAACAEYSSSQARQSPGRTQAAPHPTRACPASALPGGPHAPPTPCAQRERGEGGSPTETSGGGVGIVSGRCAPGRHAMGPSTKGTERQRRCRNCPCCKGSSA